MNEKLRPAISIMAFPRTGNPYVDCFYAPIEALGADVQGGEFSARWLLRNLRNVDFVHIHWPSVFYHLPQPRKCLRNFAVFVFLLALARWRRAGLVWTIHNLYPHERCVIPRLDALGRWLLVRMGTLFFVHAPSAEREVLREFPALASKKVVLIKHGNWIRYYPNDVSRSTARVRLGLTESVFVFLFIGSCKRYKNLEGLIHAFEQLPGNPVLLIAGKFEDPAYEAAIRTALSHPRSRVILHASFVPHDDMQLYLRACDVVVTPYNEVLTSGTAILSASFGRPVIAPAMGCLKDLIVEGCGCLYDPSQPEGLRDAMRAAQCMTFDEARILAEASTMKWCETARIVVSSLTHVRNSKHADADRGG